MLKRMVLLRIIVSFLITFLPTVAFLFFYFSKNKSRQLNQRKGHSV
jgi:hypothetical protein